MPSFNATCLCPSGDGARQALLANSLIRDFGGKAQFLYTLPDNTLAPKLTVPKGIEGESRAIPITDWADSDPVLEAISR